MNIKQEFRTNGAIGALLDEYERAISELKMAISELNPYELEVVVDDTTDDVDCKSIQTILTHVIQSGYTYAVEIRHWLGEEAEYRDKETFNNSQDYNSALTQMFNFTETLFNEHPIVELTEFDLNKKIKVRWGQIFDVEQLMQHAIVHILRHRRQIEIFKAKILKSA